MVGCYCYSLVGASCWLGLLWQGSCYDWMKNVSIKYYPEEVGTCCSTPRPEKEEGGALTQKPGRRLFRARNFANQLSKWMLIQVFYRSWLLAIAPPDQLMLTLLLLKNVSGQYVFDLWAPWQVSPIVHHVEFQPGIVRSLSLWLSSVNVWTSLYFGENFHPATDQLRSGLREESLKCICNTK